MICLRRTPDCLSLMRRAGVSRKSGNDIGALSRFQVSQLSAGNDVGQVPQTPKGNPEVRVVECARRELVNCVSLFPAMIVKSL